MNYLHFLKFVTVVYFINNITNVNMAHNLLFKNILHYKYVICKLIVTIVNYINCLRSLLKVHL